MTLHAKKEIGIVVFATLFTILFFLVMRLLFVNGSVWSIGFNITVLVGGILWAAVMSSSTAFVINRVGVNISLIALPALVLLVISGIEFGSFIGAFLLAVVIAFAQHSIHREMNSRVKFVVRGIFRGGTRLFLLALVIALITLAQPLFDDSSKVSSVLLQERYVAAVVRPFSPLLGRYIPGYTNSTTVDQIIDAQIAKQAQDLPPGFILPPNQRDIARAELSKQFGTELTGEETLPGIATTFINRYINGIAGQSTLAVAIATIAITLIIFRLFVPILVWPAIGVIYVFIDVAKRISLVALIKNQVTVDRLHL